MSHPQFNQLLSDKDAHLYYVAVFQVPVGLFIMVPEGMRGYPNELYEGLSLDNYLSDFEDASLEFQGEIILGALDVVKALPTLTEGAIQENYSLIEPRTYTKPTFSITLNNSIKQLEAAWNHFDFASAKISILSGFLELPFAYFAIKHQGTIHKINYSQNQIRLSIK